MQWIIALLPASFDDTGQAAIHFHIKKPMDCGWRRDAEYADSNPDAAWFSGTTQAPGMMQYGWIAAIKPNKKAPLQPFFIGLGLMAPLRGAK